MSNRRKRTRQMSACRQSNGQPSRAIHCPATSSMTTNCGSLRPLSRAAMVAAGTPTAMESAMPARSAIEQRLRRGMNAPGERGPQQNRGHGSPGAGTGLAVSGAEEGGDCESPSWFCFAAGGAVGTSVVIGVTAASTGASAACAAQVFQHFGVEYRRADLVNAHRPLAQVDLAATVAAEREVFVGHCTSIPQVGHL